MEKTVEAQGPVDVTVRLEPVAFMFKVKTGGTKRPVLTEFAAIDYIETGDDEVISKEPLYAIPEGWALVPVEPTEEMRKAAHDARHWWQDQPYVLDAYRAMLSAAPFPPNSNSTTG